MKICKLASFEIANKQKLQKQVALKCVKKYSYNKN